MTSWYLCRCWDFLVLNSNKGLGSSNRLIPKNDVHMVVKRRDNNKVAGIPQKTEIFRRAYANTMY
jgi:hypothetical protein